MTVTYSIELKLILEEDDSAEEFRHDIEKSIKAEWVKIEGESAIIKTKSIA